MDAAEIVAKAIARYASLSTYCDVGRIQHGRDCITFRTWFKKPHKFRLEWSDITYQYGPGSGIHRVPMTGNSVIWSPLPGRLFRKLLEQDVEQSSDINTFDIRPPALINVALLLMLPTSGGAGTILSLLDLKRLDDAHTAGHQCFRITGTLRSHLDEEIWIDKDAFTIRRQLSKAWFQYLTENDDIPPNDSLPFTSECIYDSVMIDAPIEDDLFEHV